MNENEKLPPESAGADQRAVSIEGNGSETLEVRHHVEIEISWKSILRLLVTVLVTYLAVLLWPAMKLLVLSILVAVALHPMVEWVARKGGPKWLGGFVAVATLVVVVVGCAAIIAPIVVRQMSTLGGDLPRLRDQVIAQLPPTGPVRHALESSMSPTTMADSREVLRRMLLLVESTVGGLVSIVVVIALAIYLLVDGPRTIRWLIVFFPLAHREKIRQTLSQVSRLISAYVAGQFLVSAFAATYLFAVLTWLRVPMALLLGIIAGVCDVIPIIGFFITAFMAMVMGFTVSPGTSAVVFVLYGAYHLFENFFIIPRVYGKRLRLSKLAVPLAIAAGALLGGVVGAIAVLPLVAAYPVVERLWLGSKLEPDTVKAHEASVS